MATVSEVCEAIAGPANMTVDDVKRYARALINAGDLPKAVGRSVPQTDMHQRIKLILAIAACERPADCVVAMRERYEAPSRSGDTALKAGDFLAGELRELASKDLGKFRAWYNSAVEVSRSLPQVVCSIGDAQHEFVGWASNRADLEDQMRRTQNTGLAVSAYVPGRVLIAAAFGTPDAASEASIELIRAANVAPLE